MTLPRQTNVRDSVSIEDYLAVRERAEKAEAKYAELDNWLMSLVGVASTRASARRAIERLVREQLGAMANRPGQPPPNTPTLGKRSA